MTQPRSTEPGPQVVCVSLKFEKYLSRRVFLLDFSTVKKVGVTKTKERKGCQIFQTQQKEILLKKNSKSDLPAYFLP